MKKILLSFLLLITLSACGKGAGTALDDRIVPEEGTGTVVVSNEPVEGILKAQEVKLNMYGTHILEDEMGAFIVYLQSKKINLSSYLEAKVRVEGEIVKTYDGETILEVTKVDLLSDPNEKIIEPSEQVYISQKLGINLNLPSEWQYEEGENELTLYTESGAKLIQINKIDNSEAKDLDKFVDEIDPVDLTLNSYEAIRTTEDTKINVYIKAETNVYKIIFTPVSQTATEKSQFYAMLKTFELNQKEEEQTKVCGGAGKIECDAGYRCEIPSANELATGTCVKVEDSTKEIASTEDGTENPEGNTALKDEKFQVIDYMNAHIQTLIAEKEIANAQVEGYEFSENVVSVILKDAEKKHKIQYTYTVLDEFEIDLKETAYFVEGEGRDWEKISGEDQQSSTEKEVITSEGEVQAVVLEDMRLYENTRQNYNLQYPRGWYYGSFGSIGGAIWHVGFSDEAVEIGNEKINVDIFSGKVNNVTESDSGGVFKITVPRDETSHFELTGPTDLKETIKRMAETIKKG